MDYKLIPTNIAGCFLIKHPVFRDNRGAFHKIFNKSLHKENGLETFFTEEYYSISAHNVIRGMHFQLPPREHVKIVKCITGKILDVVIDLRKNSETYLKRVEVELSSDDGQYLYIPKGCAHGFLSQCDDTVVLYKTSTEYDPLSDTGVAYDSIGFNWGVENPIISKRDEGFKALIDFESPF